eukprot:112626-Amphidinium_carterae.1
MPTVVNAESTWTYRRFLSLARMCRAHTDSLSAFNKSVYASSLRHLLPHFRKLALSLVEPSFSRL